MPQRLLSLAFVLSPLGVAPAWASSEVGTCKTSAGVLVAPWTDEADPACGEDCADEAPDAIDVAASLCADADDGCTVEADEPLNIWPTAPEPAGPRCLEPGPECSPAAPASAWTVGTASVTETTLHPLPSRAAGTLPGASVPTQVFAPCERTLEPRLRPPR